jgi:hypothetical protein
MRRILPAGALLLSVLACSTSLQTSRSTEPASRPATRSSPRASTAARLGIPPGHLPPEGGCRIWVPGTPPGRQRRPESCSGIERHAPAGSWIVYRPSRDKKLVHVRVVDNRRAGSVVTIRVYEVADGSFVREENP